jgi:hypothetical protein
MFFILTRRCRMFFPTVKTTTRSSISWFNAVSTNLYCLNPRSRRSRVSCLWFSFLPPLVILMLCLPEKATAGDDGYLPLGPHVFASANLASPLEYRDILLSSSPAASFTLGGTYRGFAVSLWHANDLSSGKNDATELFGSYSHKLPLVDLHVGAVWCSVSGRVGSCQGSARISLSSNKIRNTLLALKIDQSFTSPSRILNVSVTHKIYSARGISVAVRASGTYWDYPQAAKGFSVRAMAAKQLPDNLTINVFAGLIESRTRRGGVGNTTGAPIVGTGLSWSF